MKYSAKYVLLLIVVLGSCTQQKNLIYLQNLDKNKPEEFFLRTPVEYRIQYQDILYIRILTDNAELTEFFNFHTQTNLIQNEASIYLNGYVVNDSGYVEVPFIGSIYVLSETVESVKDKLTERAKAYLKNPVIIVKLISFKFTVVGEVNVPGVYRNYNNQLTVLEAIGMAGDITAYGDRKNILVVRLTDEGTKTFRLNLLDKNILSSEGYYLLPNDVVYVEPRISRIFQINIPNVTFALSLLSTLLLITTYIRP